MPVQQVQSEAPTTTAAGRYATLESERQPFLDRARRCAKFTLPYLFPPEGTDGADIPQPWQNVGTRGVNYLAARLLLALYPPGASFFKLALDDFMVEQLSQGQDPDARAQFDEALGKIERAVMNRFEQAGLRAVCEMSFLHLLVGGNVLKEQLPKSKGRIKMHSLERYVVQRDLAGNVLEIIVKECLKRDTLPQNVLEQLAPADDNTDSSTKDIDLYTAVRRVRNRWVVEQEIEGTVIGGTRRTFPIDKCPFFLPRLKFIDGENYARSFVEDYLGDLATLDQATQAIVEFGAAASRFIMFVKDGSLIHPSKLQNAANGSVLKGVSTDISVLQLDKFQDFRVVLETASDVKTRLEQAFLLTSSFQRQAERVTAEEIRAMAGELEQTLGGKYAVLSQEDQLPLVQLLMADMEREGKLPKLPAGTVSPQIVTGLEGLGRNSDLGRLREFVIDIGQLFGPEVVAQYINVSDYLKRKATALGMDAKGLVREEQEVQAMIAQQQQHELAQKTVPTAMQIGADAAAQQQQAPPAA